MQSVLTVPSNGKSDHQICYKSNSDFLSFRLRRFHHNNCLQNLRVGFKKKRSRLQKSFDERLYNEDVRLSLNSFPGQIGRVMSALLLAQGDGSSLGTVATFGAILTGR